MGYIKNQKTPSELETNGLLSAKQHRGLNFPKMNYFDVLAQIFLSVIFQIFILSYLATRIHSLSNDAQSVMDPWNL